MARTGLQAWVQLSASLLIAVYPGASLTCVGFRFFTCKVAGALPQAQVVVRINEVTYVKTLEQCLGKNTHIVKW